MCTYCMCVLSEDSKMSCHGLDLGSTKSVLPPAAVPDNTPLIIGVVVAVVIVFLLAILVGFIIVLVKMKCPNTSEAKWG